MKVSLNLLGTFARFDTKLPQLIELVGARIGQVEQVIELGSRYRGIVAAEIIEAKDHPDADKLGVYQVKIGTRTVQVVAGDKTLQPGDKVAYIPPGTTVPVTAETDEPVVIAKRDLRGQLSNGMLGSAYELAFGPDHGGVLKLDGGRPGQPLADVYQLDDVILDIENKVLTHRPDLFGHLGFARELAGVLSQSFASPGWFSRPPAWSKAKSNLPLAIGIDQPKLSSRFSASLFSGVSVGPSSIQMQTWLNRLGVRPLNNVVDLSNFLMLLTGQPLHAFDYDKVVKIGGAELRVRLAKAGERLKLLDGQTVKLDPADLVIAGRKAVLGLAGVMGGAATEVDATTTNVIFEAANFDMYSIRNTSMRHGIQSEAVTRFARGQDPHSITAVQSQVLEYMTRLGAAPASGLLDRYPRPRRGRSVLADPDHINRLLGLELDPAAMAKRLNQVELKTIFKAKRLRVSVPTWRPDLHLEEDIAEEIGRLHGYDLIPPRLPSKPIAATVPVRLEVLRRRAADILAAAGANELLTYSGVSRELLAASGQDAKHAFVIRNAISPDLHHMRLSLTPSLLQAVSPNLRRGFDKFALFEIGAVHHKTLLDGGLPDEQTALALVFAAGLKTAPEGAAYYQAVKYLMHLLECLGYAFDLSETLDAKDPWLVQASAPYAPNRRAAVTAGGTSLGVVGELSAAVARQLKLPRFTSAFELNLGRLLKTASGRAPYRPLSRFPRVTADLTLKIPSSVSFEKLTAAIAGGRPQPPLEVEIWPLGIYQAKAGHKNVTYRLDFVSHERTLKQSEVNQLVARMAGAAKSLGAEVV